MNSSALTALTASFSSLLLRMLFYAAPAPAPPCRCFASLLLCCFAALLRQIIGCTGDERPAEVLAFTAAGADDVAVKPVDMGKLMASLGLPGGTSVPVLRDR